MKYNFKRSQVVDAVKLTGNMTFYVYGPNMLGRGDKSFVGGSGDYFVTYGDSSQAIINGSEFERDFEPSEKPFVYIIEYRNLRMSKEWPPYAYWRRSEDVDTKLEFDTCDAAWRAMRPKQAMMASGGHEYRVTPK